MTERSDSRGLSKNETGRVAQNLLSEVQQAARSSKTSPSVAMKLALEAQKEVRSPRKKSRR